MIELPVITSLIVPVGSCNELSCDHCSIMYDTLFAVKMPSCLRFSKSEAYLGMVILWNLNQLIFLHLNQKTTAKKPSVSSAVSWLSTFFPIKHSTVTARENQQSIGGTYNALNIQYHKEIYTKQTLIHRERKAGSVSRYSGYRETCDSWRYEYNYACVALSCWWDHRRERLKNALPWSAFEKTVSNWQER